MSPPGSCPPIRTSAHFRFAGSGFIDVRIGGRVSCERAPKIFCIIALQALRTDVGRLNVIGVEQKSDLPLRDRAPLYPAQMEVGSSRNLAAAATA
jgi:hypothetical protein